MTIGCFINIFPKNTPSIFYPIKMIKTHSLEPKILGMTMCLKLFSILNLFLSLELVLCFVSYISFIPLDKTWMMQKCYKEFAYQQLVFSIVNDYFSIINVTCNYYSVVQDHHKQVT
jgi:hypothetical protein